MICINLEEFILECKANKQRKADNIKCTENMYYNFHKEACIHASYGDMYKPIPIILLGYKCPVCTCWLKHDSFDFKTSSGLLVVTVYTCTKCNYRYVHDMGLFGIELESCKKKE